MCSYYINKIMLRLNHKKYYFVCMYVHMCSLLVLNAVISVIHTHICTVEGENYIVALYCTTLLRISDLIEYYCILHISIYVNEKSNNTSIRETYF